MLPQPGSPNFHSALIAHVREALPNGVHIDTKILVGILLCLVAGGKHLVVEMEDIGLNEKRVVEMRHRVCGMVRLITTLVFGLRTIVKSPLNSTFSTTAASLLHRSSPPRRPRTSTRSSTPRHRSTSQSHRVGTPSTATPTRMPSSLDASRELRPAQTPSQGREKSSEETKLPQVLVLPNLHEAPDHVQNLLLHLMMRRKVDLSTSTGDLGEDSMVSRETALPEDFICVWVKDPYSNVPGWLLDKFALNCSASAGATDGSDVYAVIPPTSAVEAPIIPPQFITSLHNLSNKTHMHPTLRLQISDLTSIVLHHPHLHPTITSHSISEFRTFVRISRIFFREFTVGPGVLERLDELGKGRTYDQRGKLQEAMEGEEWFATPVDVARVWGNLMEHRVGWREGKDEVMFTLRGGAGYVMSGMVGTTKTEEERKMAAKKQRRKDRKEREQVWRILKEIQETVR